MMQYPYDNFYALEFLIQSVILHLIKPKLPLAGYAGTADRFQRESPWITNANGANCFTC